MTDRVRTKCGGCGMDVIVGAKYLDTLGLTSPVDTVLAAIESGAAGFRCIGCAKVKR